VAATTFEIEGAFKGGDGRGYVVARLLDLQAGFDVSPISTLGGFNIERWLDMPRAFDAHGQRMDLFGFCLKNTTDLERLKVGDRVVLT
jgi:hypothetical protein